MLTLFEQIDKGTLWHSIGGIHPPERKSISNHTPIKTLPLAAEYIIPLPQVGESAVLVVKPGDYVAKGTALTQGSHFGHLAVHAPTSGHISKIEPRPSNHASGLDILSCVIIPDGLDTQIDTLHTPLNAEELDNLSNQQILTKIQSAGIAGLGGAAFPTHIKLNPASDIELVIINAIECEPYITSDDMIMREKSDDILNGIAIIHRLLSPKRLIIAIEDNKPEAIEKMQHALNRSALPKHGVRITTVPTLYPSGGEKQLVQILTGQEVPSGAIPAQLGILVQNVATAYAINEAVLKNQPLIERVITITGENTQEPGNYWVPIGTPISHLLTQTGFKGTENDKVIIGGPMMGYALYNDNAPSLKGSNCILLPSSNELAPEQKELPCVRCGECAHVCPAQLLPQQLFWHSKAEEYDKAANFHLADCIECGCCTYVCPSEIPLVEYYRIAKSAIRNEAEEKKQAELAKQRFELRTQRLDDEKLAREAKQKAAAQRRKANMTSSDKDAVALAMARIKAKKEAVSSAPQGASQSDSKRSDISAAVARAKAKKAAFKAETDTDLATQSDKVTSTDASTPIDDKKAKIAAAVARAKAKKAALKAETDTDLATQSDEVTSADASTPIDDKKAKIAAAVARAKAKKAALKAETDTDLATQSDEVTSADASTPIDDKKAKIAAAVARAKAKKATLKAETDTDLATQSDEVTSADASTPIDDKKAKIAAAVARAKAKKAALKAKSEKTGSDTNLATQPDDVTSADELAPVDDKKARIAAAVARAKAKKAALKAESEKPGSEKTGSDTNLTTQPDGVISADEPTPVDDKKVRIAAAVAKAKAKKAAQAHSSKIEHEKE
ncbi:electron transport complex subunit RsxC [Shewanella eurypsychrophilus]|uniref:Ion-translocating oxidoreductase complex subunit C n=1 Tax=Shewanella eurypsychrophilus TaxID=2593656 RepID=A0ABX6V6H3_9GAMM|nr:MULTISPECIES: electron transport complex subunit RsxC [Shewanella]QFU22655.1 electron transport complex subunit RsxC [Shewanella sp. YLB-09]QPG57944.1 electron transport complex subunit RsxC [Shewanella eurypsychrophilus]